MLVPYKHQEELSEHVLYLLRNFGIAYLAMEERTGKTLTAILAVEKSNAEKCLVITKKKALDGWHDTLENYNVSKHYDVVNYHQAYKYVGTKYDVVILDESHNYISSFPKPGKIWKEIKPLCKDVPLLYISATPHAQGLQMLFHQFALSSFSPWYKFVNGYNWFRIYGKPHLKKIMGRNVEQYDRVDEHLVLSQCKHLFITKTRQELGFEHEPEDNIHWIELAKNTRQVYNTLVSDNYINLSVGELVCDSDSKLRTSLHQIEGGTIKINDSYNTLSNTEKVDYILKNFGDRDDLVIMYNFKQEAKKLSTYFKHALLLQATSNAEGVDLHKYSDLIIYSQDYSTARHTQRRARQCNMKRDTPIVVHYLLVKKAVSHQVYKTVSLNKKNFVDSVFTRDTL